MSMNYAETMLGAPRGLVLEGDDPLPTQIAGYIRNLIIHDVLKPGEPVRERVIAAELNVSRTPLRDALKLLSVERLVELFPNRGAVVVNNSIDDISDMLTVYTELEALGAAAACRAATERDFLRVERHLALMEEANAEHDRLKYFRANQAFHLAIISASRNKALIEIHANLSLRLYRVRYLAIMAQEIWQARSHEHQLLVETLRARDIARMTELQRAHFHVAWRLIDDWATREPKG